MKVSKYFIIIIIVVLIATYGVNYFVTNRISTIENSKPLSTLDSYLSERFSLSLRLDKKVEDAISIFCDNENTKEESLLLPVSYSCQNKNPVHKIIIGSADDNQNYVTIIQSIGNEQLFWKNAIDATPESGRMICKEWFDAKGYNNVVAGINCTTAGTSGEKLYASIVFLESTANQKGKVFIGVVNTRQASSIEKTEQEVIALLSNQRISTVGRIIKFISFLRRDAVKINSIIEVSSTESVESERLDKSFSLNFMTPFSGEGIDGEVCDASKTNSCYPIYCISTSAVWGKLLSKCVEPDVPNKEAVEGVLCLGDLPVWDGSKCRALVGDIISSNICEIGTGENSCEIKFVWSVDSPIKKVEVKYLGVEAVLLSNATSGSLSYAFPFSKEPQTVGLFEGDKKINEGKFISRCKTGGFDDISNTCVDPRVINAYVVGEYYADKGRLIFSCDTSDTYSVKNSEKNILVATGTYFQEVKVPVDVSGNYSITCSKGNYSGPPTARYYNAPPPPPPVLFLSVSPQSVPLSGTTTLDWNILYPRDECTLKAKSYCKASGCTQEQSDSENILNQILETENVDQSSALNPVNIQESLKRVPEDGVSNELRTVGKKKVAISHTTDFILNCGNDIEVKKRIYTQKIQKSEEQ